MGGSAKPRGGFVGGILGKSINDYIKIVTLPVAVWLLWDILMFVVGIIFAAQIAAAATAGGAAAATGAGLGMLGMLAILGIFGWLLYLAIGLWIGWRTVKSFRGNLPQAVVAGLAVGIINIAFVLVLNIFSAVITGQFASIIFAILGAIIGGVISLVVVAVLAAVGAFIAQMMKK